MLQPHTFYFHLPYKYCQTTNNTRILCYCVCLSKIISYVNHKLNRLCPNSFTYLHFFIRNKGIYSPYAAAACASCCNNRLQFAKINVFGFSSIKHYRVHDARVTLRVFCSVPLSFQAHNLIFCCL